VRGLRRQALRAAGAALALGALLAAAGCGAEADGTDGGAAPAELLGTRPGKVTCTDWNQGTDEERLGTLQQLTMLASGNANPENVGPNRTLSDEDAYRVLESACSPYLARGFLLYEVYNRAAAFSPGSGE
jgi:hypothetical protein